MHLALKLTPFGCEQALISTVGYDSKRDEHSSACYAFDALFAPKLVSKIEKGVRLIDRVSEASADASDNAEHQKHDHDDEDDT
jgi:hypothetical protein